jgi:hypothetical protein
LLKFTDENCIKSLENWWIELQIIYKSMNVYPQHKRNDSRISTLFYFFEMQRGQNPRQAAKAAARRTPSQNNTTEDSDSETFSTARTTTTTTTTTTRPTTTTARDASDEETTPTTNVNAELLRFLQKQETVLTTM